MDKKLAHIQYNIPVHNGLANPNRHVLMRPWITLISVAVMVNMLSMFVVDSVQGGVKVLITGPWQEASSDYSCLFDQITVPASLIQPGVLRCYCPGSIQ